MARAQEYPGPSPTTTVGPTADETFAGTFFQGNTFTNEACGFKAGSTTEVRFNGELAGNDNVENDGCARQVVTVTQVDTASSGALGRPVFAAVGLLRQFAAVRSVKVEILGKTFPGKGDGTDQIVATGVGANGQPRTFTTKFKAADPADAKVLGSTLSKLSRTGADLLPVALIGGALVAIGALLRRARRSATPAPAE